MNARMQFEWSTPELERYKVFYQKYFILFK